MTARDDLTCSVARDTGLTETQVRDVLDALVANWSETAAWLRWQGLIKRTRWVTRDVPRDPRKAWWEKGYSAPKSEVVEGPAEGFPLWTVHQ